MKGYIGRLTEDGSKFYVDLNSFLEAHVSILSKVGRGKSYLAGVLIEEFARNKVPVLIIDTHGEYRTMIYPNDDRRSELFRRFGVVPKGLPSKVRVYSVNRKGDLSFTMSDRRLRIRDLENLYPGKLKDSHKERLSQIIFEARGSKYNIDDLMNKAVEGNGQSKYTLLSVLEQIKSLKLFSSRFTKATDLVKKRKITILDLNLLPRQLQRTIVASVLEMVFMARKAGKIPPLALVIDEAHIYAPQMKSVVSSEVFKDVTAEGRKFGLATIIVTQRPSRISKDILSQPQVQIYLKVTNPNDLKAIYDSIENATPELRDELKTLKRGQCLISGVDDDKALKVDVRVRRTKHGGRSQRFGE